MSAPNTVHTVEVLIGSLPTKSVTFAPASATVVREIQDIQLKPGPNEITIFGLDPAVDVDSIRVDGRGPATITDIQTEKVPRREQFEDVYPDEDDDDDDEISDTDPDNDYGIDKTKLEEARLILRDCQAEIAGAKDQQSSAIMSLQFMDKYGQSMDSRDVDVSKMNEFLTLYERKRDFFSASHQKSSANVTNLKEVIKIHERRVLHLERAYEKAKKVASKEARKEREKRIRVREQKRKRKQRIMAEQQSFWTSSVSQVIVHLDGFPGCTPASSGSSMIVIDKSVEIQDTVSLSLTYVLSLASWSPRYELSINTPSSSGKIIYRAEFENSSSETWTNTKVVLSTSQTSFSGLDERIPSLQAWHVKLGKSEAAGPGKKADWSSGLESKSEINARITMNMKHTNTMAANKASGGNCNSPLARLAAAQMQQQQQSLFQTQSQQTPQVTASLFGAPSSSALLQAPAGSALDPSISFGCARFRAASDEPSASDEDRRIRSDYAVQLQNAVLLSIEEDPDADNLTLSDSHNALAYQESLRQDYGLTTTYDLPGHRTLAPSSVRRRHVIAELDLSSVALSYILVPKLRAAAFLKAKIKNTSLVTLLRGKAGMTVDGTFLGSTTLPACGPENHFNLSLGVDPSILVTYAKPTVRRATSGFFNKEDSAVFTRVCWIKNTKNAAVSITVIDQVPVSEDGMLRVNILEPKGLEKEGDQKKLEVSKVQWGKGAVIYEKNGGIKWDLDLQKGKDIKLILEYEARIPSGQKIIGLD